MGLVGLLLLIAKLTKDNHLSTPLICGGTPRDKILGRPNQLKDIDLTTGDGGSLTLPFLLQPQWPGSHVKTLDDGHSQVTLDNLKLDFSSNFRVDNIIGLLQEAGLKRPTPMQQELYSRDFTCNALLLSLDLSNLQDPTGLGIKDINRKVLRTCLPASITLAVDHKRIPRVLYLAAKLGFEVDGEIINWIRLNSSAVLDCKPQYLHKKISEALALDKDRTIDLIKECHLGTALAKVL